MTGNHMQDTQIYQGGCHCGDVRFQLNMPQITAITRCNCSMCSKNDFLHVFVPHQQFELLSDAAALTEYRFHTGAARHLFCSRCGIKSYYQPRSHPDCWSVNARCIEQLDIDALQVDEFDGQNWSTARQRLSE